MAARPIGRRDQRPTVAQPMAFRRQAPYRQSIQRGPVSPVIGEACTEKFTDWSHRFAVVANLGS